MNAHERGDLKRKIPKTRNPPNKKKTLGKEWSRWVVVGKKQNNGEVGGRTGIVKASSTFEGIRAPGRVLQ